METKRKLLNHFLAALAYRTQKALREAPETFADFRAGTHVRTPREIARPTPMAESVASKPSFQLTDSPLECGS